LVYALFSFTHIYAKAAFGCYVKFEDTKGIIRSRKWNKDRQYNGQNK